MAASTMSNTIGDLRNSIQSRYLRTAREEIDRPSRPAGEERWVENHGAGPGGIGGRWARLPVEDERMDAYHQDMEDYRADVEQRAEELAMPQMAALDMWEHAREGVAAANAAAMEDRDDMLSRIEAYEDGYNEDWKAQTLAREKAYWDTRREQTLNRIQNQFAAMNRVPDPFILGEINRRMLSQETSAMQSRMMELEQEIRNRRQWAMQMRGRVYEGTQRQVPDPAQVLGIVENLGAASSNVEAAAA